MSARDWALSELDARSLPDWPAGLLRHRARPPSDVRDLALAENLIIGTVKNLLLLRHLIGHYANRPLSQIDPLIQKVLAIGLYQIRFLDRIPAPAAVHETVEQARRAGRSRAAGFVNAVMRNALREPAPPLPAAADDPADHARLALSHPPELFERLRAALGTQGALRFCEHDNAQPPIVLRLGAGVTIQRLLSTDTPRAAGDDPPLQLLPHQQPGLVVVHNARRAALARWAEAGLAQPQDPTAARVVPMMNALPGQRVLDRCCGLGTKTLQIATLLGDGGQLHAMDPNARRLDILRQTARLQGVPLTLHCAAFIAEVPALAVMMFDRILVDAPCGNSGVLARRPEARYAQGDRAMESLVRLQRAIQ